MLSKSVTHIDMKERINEILAQEFFGKLLREIRTKEHVGLQKEIAQKMGYRNSNMVAQLEKGATKPGVGKIRDILDAYNAPEMALVAYVYLNCDLWAICGQVERSLQNYAKGLEERSFDSGNPEHRAELIRKWLLEYSDEYGMLIGTDENIGEDANSIIEKEDKGRQTQAGKENNSDASNVEPKPYSLEWIKRNAKWGDGE